MTSFSCEIRSEFPLQSVGIYYKHGVNLENYMAAVNSGGGDTTTTTTTAN